MTYRTGLLAISLTMLGASGAMAQDARAATYLVDANLHTRNAFINFAAAVAEATGGALAFELHTGGALLPARTMLTGIRDGVAHLGFVTTSLTPSELPVTNLLPAMGYLNTDPFVLGAANADWLMHEAAGYDEFLRNGVVPVGGNSLPNIVYLCASEDPPDTLAELSGLRIRQLAGGLAGEVSNVLGFTPVGMPATELFLALQNGQIDCAGILGTYINVDMQLHEVIESVVLVNFPPTFTDPMHIYNVDFWRGLDDGQRRVLLDTTAQTMAEMAVEFEQATLGSYEFARGEGMQVVTAQPEVLDAVAAWAETLPTRVAEEAAAAGIEDSQGFVDTYASYIAKWEGLIGGLEDRADADALAALLRENIFDTIDESTYGME